MNPTDKKERKYIICDGILYSEEVKYLEHFLGRFMNIEYKIHSEKIYLNSLKHYEYTYSFCMNNDDYKHFEEYMCCIVEKLMSEKLLSTKCLTYSK